MRVLASLTVILFFSMGAHAQSGLPHVPVTPAPSWVEHIAPPSDPFIVDPVDGARFLVSDRQRNFTTGEPVLYIRTLVQATTPAGLQTAAAWQIVFDPTYQRAELHSVRIHRNGQIIDLSRQVELDIFRREQNLERQMFDGRYTASLQVPGVSVGDIVEVAYSLTGWRNAFRGRYFDRASIAFGTPVGQLFTRIIWPADRPAQVLRHAMDENDLTRLDQPGRTEYRYGPVTTRATRHDAGVPGWRQRRPGFEIGDFDSWSGFASWADAWFESEITPDNPGLIAYAESIRASASDPSELGLAEAALARIQNDIRYLAVSLGDGGFEPRSISETLSSRFGDCKDKTVLLTSVLRRFGLDAVPALTGISQGRAADTYLPGVAAFDHVIVRLETGGETYWLDPTRSYQRGQLQGRSLYQPDYGFALPLEEATALVAMRNEEHAYPVTVLIEETVDGSEGLEDPGWLDLHVEYTLDEADQVRRFYAAQGRSGVRAYFADIYNRRFPGMEVVEDGFALVDDHDSNRITIDIRYSLPEVFQLNRNIRYLEMLTYGLPRVFSEDVTGRRSDPVAIPYPIHAVHRTRLDLPGSRNRWNLRTGNRRIVNDAFIYEFERRAEDGYFIFEHSLRTQAAEIAPESAQEAFDEYLEVNANRNLSVWRRR